MKANSLKLKNFIVRLKEEYSDLPSCEIDWLILAVVGFAGAARGKLYELSSHEVTGEQRHTLQNRLERLRQGEPLAYLTGEQSFLDASFAVEPCVLIPRADTEAWVHQMLSELESSPPKTGIEIGVGSGVISISLLLKFPSLKMIASDFSDDAIRVASKNAEKLLGPRWKKRLEIRKVADARNVLGVFDGVKAADLLVSNPPYVAAEDELGAGVKEHEPDIALIPAGGDALHFYREIATTSDLQPGGLAYLEGTPLRSDEIEALYSTDRWTTSWLQDLTGRKRCLRATLRQD